MPPAGVLTLLTVHARFLLQSLSKTVRILTGSRETLAVSPVFVLAVSRDRPLLFAYITSKPEYAMPNQSAPQLLHYCIEQISTSEVVATRLGVSQNPNQRTN